MMSPNPMKQEMAPRWLYQEEDGEDFLSGKVPDFVSDLSEDDE